MTAPAVCPSGSGCPGRPAVKASPFAATTPTPTTSARTGGLVVEVGDGKRDVPYRTNWVGALERSTAASPLARVVEGLVLAVDPDATPEQMANSVAMLQLDLADPDFHAETLRGARAVRARIARDLSRSFSRVMGCRRLRR